MADVLRRAPARTADAVWSEADTLVDQAMAIVTAARSSGAILGMDERFRPGPEILADESPAPPGGAQPGGGAAGGLPQGPVNPGDPWWKGLPVTPITPLSEQPPCPEPSRWEWMSGPHGEGGHWVCVTPPSEWSVWMLDHFVEGVFPLPEILPPAICCCPVSIEVVGGDSKGQGYRYDPTLDEEAKRPGCQGNSFVVRIVVHWYESDRFRPCTLEWHEWNSMPSRRDYRNRDVDEYAAQAASPEGITSPTLAPWARVMNPESIGVDARGATLRRQTEREAERARAVQARNESLRDAAGTDMPIPLKDSPCIQPTDVDLETGRSERSMAGRVVVRSGCPVGGDCKKGAIEVYWSQYVRFGSDGRLEALYFAQAPDYVWSRDNPLRPRSSWRPGVNAEGQEWERRWRQLVRQQPRLGR